MLLGEKIRAIVVEVQRLLPAALPKWQARLLEWAVAVHDLMKKARSEAHVMELGWASVPPISWAVTLWDKIPVLSFESSGTLLPVRPSLPYQYALLAALNDSLADEDATAVRIEPWASIDGKEQVTLAPEELAGAAAYGVLKCRLDELREGDEQRLRDILQVVKADLLVPQVVRDAASEARDKWLYDQCVKLVPYKGISNELQKQPAEWPRLESVNGVKDAAAAYAERQRLPPIPKRKRGRPGQQ